MVGVVLTVVVFGFGLLVVGALLLSRARSRRTWSGPSLPASATAGLALEDPAAAGSTAGTEQNTTEGWAVAQAESRTLGAFTSGAGNGGV